MGPQEMRKLMKSCTQDCAPECTSACPVHVDARKLCENIRENRFDKGLAAYSRTVYFPHLVGAFCTAPCEAKCKRQEVGEARTLKGELISGIEIASCTKQRAKCVQLQATGEPIAIRALEESLWRYGSCKPLAITPFMSLNKSVAVIGGGISGLAAALYLYEKGFKVTVYERQNRLGGRGWQLDSKLAAKDFEFLNDISWTTRLDCVVGKDIPLSEITGAFDGVYLSGDATLLNGCELDPQTFQSVLEPKVFIGGSIVREEPCYSIIDSVSSGIRCGVSLDRFMKKVSITASRHQEGSYATALYTDIDTGTDLSSRVRPAGEYYTRDEARKEANRCLDCECMRCVKQCLYMQRFENYPHAIIQEMATHIGMIAGQKQSGPLINSCSMCGLCEELCPNSIKMPDSVLAARQTLVSKNQNVEAVHDFPLRDMDFSNGDGFSLWKSAPEKPESKYLFYPGCQLAATLPKLMLPTYEYLLKKLDGDVGVGLGCCGAPAHWSGYERRHRDSLKVLRENWESLGKPIMITACSTCQKQISDAYPDIPMLSLWEVFEKNGLPETGNPRPAIKAAVQDACGARGMSKVHESIRRLLSEMSCEIEELGHSKGYTKCCNYGGLMTYANHELAKDGLAERINESPLDYIVYCGACLEQFTRGGKRTWHMLELLFGEKQDEVTDITGKRQNRRDVKRYFAEKYYPCAETKGEDSMKLVLSDAVRKRLDERLILAEDIENVINAAETSGKKLKKPENGHFIAHLQPGIITYWVEYEPVQDGYAVYNAYSHRLQIVDD